MPTRRITLQDIAGKVGVSSSTVCRVLRGDSRISEQTAVRVKEIAAKLGYRPDPLLSALSLRRHDNSAAAAVTTIAYISHAKADTDPYQHLCFEGASVRAGELGYRLERFLLDKDGLSPQRLGKILYARGIIGACWAPVEDSFRHRLVFDWEKFANAAIGVSLERPALHRSSTHHFQGMILALERLQGLGFSRIGICLDACTNERIERLWQAAGLLVAQLNPDSRFPAFIHSTREPNDATQIKFCRWLKQERPEVIIGPNVIQQWLREEGLRIPEDISFAALHWDVRYPEVAGMDQCTTRIAAEAVDLVVEQINKRERGIPSFQRTVLIKGSWRDGASVAPRLGHFQ